MEKIITPQTLRRFCYCNIEICKKPIRGVVVIFNGLNWMDMYEKDFEEACKYAEKGYVYLVPYNNPWAWMNKQTVDLTDELLDVLFEAYGLSEDIPITYAGGSMGGQQALVYTYYGKRKPVACVANCPVCDLPYHFTERNDLPRTLYSAFQSYDGNFEDALRSASPLHLADKMPVSTSYFIFHCDEDKAVNINMHSKKFVEKMRQKHKVKFYIVEGKGHCDLTTEMREKFDECVTEFLGNGIDTTM